MTKVTHDYVEVTDIFPSAKPSKKVENFLYSGKVVDYYDQGATSMGLKSPDWLQAGTKVLIAKLFTYPGPDGPKYFVHRNAIVATWTDD